jgi:hypothetical protein
MRPLLLVTVVLTAACAIDPAPADTSELMHWLYRHASDASDDELRDAVSKLHDDVGSVAPLSAEKLTLPALAADDGLVVGLKDRDASLATGMMHLNAIPCAFARVEELFVDADQKKVFGGYESYAREFVGDPAAFDAGTLARLGFHNVYTVAGLGTRYTAKISGEFRRVEGAGPGSPRGPALVARAFLTEPAAFDAGSTDYFRQDYQLRVIYERSPGDLVHAFAVWREMKFAGSTADSDLFQTTTLNQFANGDKGVASQCHPK